MATIDRANYHNEPCPCGRGKIIVLKCSPDHSYTKPDDYWYEGKIECEQCKTNYEMQQLDTGNKSFVVLEQKDQNFKRRKIVRINPVYYGFR